MRQAWVRGPISQPSPIRPAAVLSAHRDGDADRALFDELLRLQVGRVVHEVLEDPQHPPRLLAPRERRGRAPRGCASAASGGRRAFPPRGLRPRALRAGDAASGCRRRRPRDPRASDRDRCSSASPPTPRARLRASSSSTSQTATIFARGWSQVPEALEIRDAPASEHADSDPFHLAASPSSKPSQAAGGSSPPPTR